MARATTSRRARPPASRSRTTTRRASPDQGPPQRPHQGPDQRRRRSGDPPRRDAAGGVADFTPDGRRRPPYPGHMSRMSESGTPIERVYEAKNIQHLDPEHALGEPGAFPFTRGIYPGMYVSRPWTMRQYAGFSTAADSNRRYHQLIEAGTTGLSVAFDLPTQMGYDSDAPQAAGEVGKVGGAIASVEGMRLLLAGIPLDTVSTSMTINAPAAILLLLYQLVAAEQGVSGRHITGKIQNYLLKESSARGTYIFPPQPSLRLIADTFAYCRTEI